MGEVTLRAVTFNARHGLGLDGCRDLSRTAALLRWPAPDLSCFPASHPAAATDWVLTRAPIRHLSQAWAPSSQVSDHLPVLATVGW
jgi:endonuclease/exonuclease/phosphatase family metal-dependent hydrolase